MRNSKLKKAVVIIAILLVIALFFVFVKVLSHNTKESSRCSDSENYKLKNSTISKVKDSIKQIANVDSIDIHTHYCTIKIIITLSNDVDLEEIKNKSNEILSLFKEKDLKHYDFSLYVDSKDKNSETYPINVTKHKTRDTFSW